MHYRDMTTEQLIEICDHVLDYKAKNRRVAISMLERFERMLTDMRAKRAFVGGRCAA